MRFRAMQPRDLRQIIAIEDRVSPVPWTRQQFCDSINNHCAKVLEYPSSLCGFAIYSAMADQAQLLNIAIHPESQGCGWGRRLLELIIEEIPAGIDNLFLDVRVSNFRAIRLYQSYNFHKIGERKSYYRTSNDSVREDALAMCRKMH